MKALVTKLLEYRGKPLETVNTSAAAIAAGEDVNSIATEDDPTDVDDVADGDLASSGLTGSALLVARLPKKERVELLRESSRQELSEKSAVEKFRIESNQKIALTLLNGVTDPAVITAILNATVRGAPAAAPLPVSTDTKRPRSAITAGPDGLAAGGELERPAKRPRDSDVGALGGDGAGKPPPVRGNSRAAPPHPVFGYFYRFTSEIWSRKHCVSMAVLKHRPVGETRTIPELLQAVSDAATQSYDPALTLRGVPHVGATVYADKDRLEHYVRHFRNILWPRAKDAPGSADVDAAPTAIAAPRTAPMFTAAAVPSVCLLFSSVVTFLPQLCF